MTNYPLSNELGMKPESAEILGRRLVILLQHGLYETAVKAIISAEIEAVGRTRFGNIYTSLLDSPIVNSSLPERACNILENNNFIYWRDVVDLGAEWLENHIINWGKSSSIALQIALREEIAKRQRLMNNI